MNKSMTIISIATLEESYKKKYGKLKNNIFNNYEILKYETLNSTMDVVKKNISIKENLNQIIMADFQKKGHGRFNRKWYSAKKKNLLASFPITTNKELLPYIPIILSLSIFQTLKKFVDNNSDLKIKWPNDILLNSKKISGMIIESNIKKNDIFINFGVGININSNLNDLSGKGFDATSLLIEKSKNFDIDEVLYFLILNISNNLSYSNDKFIEWKKNLFLPKKEIYLNENRDNKFTISDVDEFGNLIVYRNNKEFKLSADEISFQD